MKYVSGTKPTIVAFNMPCVQIPIHIHWTMLMLLQNKILNVQKTLLKLMVSSKVVMATGLSRPEKSREGPGTGQDRTGPRDLEGPVVLWSRD